MTTTLNEERGDEGYEEFKNGTPILPSTYNNQVMFYVSSRRQQNRSKIKGLSFPVSTEEFSFGSLSLSVSLSLSQYLSSSLSHRMYSVFQIPNTFLVSHHLSLSPFGFGSPSLYPHRQVLASHRLTISLFHRRVAITVSLSHANNTC